MESANANASSSAVRDRADELLDDEGTPAQHARTGHGPNSQVDIGSTDGDVETMATRVVDKI
eukprot:11782645-Karenia_brevis.AAC.1